MHPVLLFPSFVLRSSQKSVVTNQMLGMHILCIKTKPKMQMLLVAGFRIFSKCKHDLTVFLVHVGTTQGFIVLVCVRTCWVLGRL